MSITAQQKKLPAGHFLFTSESVGEGHPGQYRFKLCVRVLNILINLIDKICDQVSDAIVCCTPTEDRGDKQLTVL
jgi:S-adenosylmethionine synthetase